MIGQTTPEKMRGRGTCTETAEPSLILSSRCSARPPQCIRVTVTLASTIVPGPIAGEPSQLVAPTDSVSCARTSTRSAGRHANVRRVRGGRTRSQHLWWHDLLRLELVPHQRKAFIVGPVPQAETQAWEEAGRYLPCKAGWQRARCCVCVVGPSRAAARVRPRAFAAARALPFLAASRIS